MEIARILQGPSAEAKAFVDDPANRKDGPFDLGGLQAERAEARALAERDAPNFARAGMSGSRGPRWPGAMFLR